MDIFFKFYEILQSLLRFTKNLNFDVYGGLVERCFFFPHENGQRKSQHLQKEIRRTDRMRQKMKPRLLYFRGLRRCDLVQRFCFFFNRNLAIASFVPERGITRGVLSMMKICRRPGGPRKVRCRARLLRSDGSDVVGSTREYIKRENDDERERERGSERGNGSKRAKIWVSANHERISLDVSWFVRTRDQTLEHSPSYLILRCVTLPSQRPLCCRNLRVLWFLRTDIVHRKKKIFKNRLVPELLWNHIKRYRIVFSSLSHFPL